MGEVLLTHQFILILSIILVGQDQTNCLVLNQVSTDTLKIPHSITII